MTDPTLWRTNELACPNCGHTESVVFQDQSKRDLNSMGFFATMSMLYVAGLNKGIQSTPNMRLAALGVRSFRAVRPLAVAQTKPRNFGGPLIYPGGSYIKGTVNDPADVPKPDPAHGSYHWDFERLISVSLVPLVAGAAVKHGACAVLDGGLSLALLLHTHLGFDTMLTDYVDKRKFPLLGPVAKWILRFITLGAGYGLYEFNTNDVGISELVVKLWRA
ncbi:membrane anchor subunit of succinate dehydrogenase, Sdh4 [Malassezia cuniculi]|uniref:Succinate dehydrogenase [ubiquinone] cytochrome b small subunit n=1 Tax=Malassezia cuniculi TaxID=948313 RepID=A0AAF0J4S3_9BASI|nr:membrane anchor subunit of succinate dehydrogenase, Sdh4 [Malassezia cuniculi]